ncbi:hypothetical protein WDV06_26500 [Streptomyces racemochromogenes]|uniref:Uncharacterized protein n=1 Tax=Streptomyces racemochromogenes TaxID=67353 RepID=A0ABW7PJL6_9ACTN
MWISWLTALICALELGAIRTSPGIAAPWSMLPVVSKPSAVIRSPIIGISALDRARAASTDSC